MKLSSMMIVSIVFLSACSTSGHGGRITSTGGLEATCAGGCAEFKSDGSGCARFHDSTSKSCAAYFDTLCKSSPSQCAN